MQENIEMIRRRAPETTRKGTALNTASKLRLAAVLSAIVALCALTAGGTATAGANSKGATEVIKIKNNDHPRFVGPDVIAAGSTLEIVNLTDPVRAHSFSLVAKDRLPKTERQIKRCVGKLPPSGGGVCGDIVAAHTVYRSSYVDVGTVPGWDLSFDRDSGDDSWGDSWQSSTESLNTERIVAVDPGEKLFYLCAVHARMQGKFVVGPAR